MSIIPTIKLNDGNTMPAIGLGTYINSVSENFIDFLYLLLNMIFFFIKKKSRKEMNVNKL